MINRNEWRIIGMARSGNHAIINWILKQLEGRYCFLNCAEPKTNPFHTARPFNDAGEKIITNIPDLDLEEEKEGKFSQKDHLIHSYEDCFLGMFNKKSYQACHDLFVGSTNEKLNILVLRDPFNLFASRIKAGLMNGQYNEYGTRPVSLHIVKKIYQQHAKQYLHIKNYFNEPVVTVNYNQWVKSEAYRKRLAEKLGLEFNDAAAKEVVPCAGGSSFDGTEFHNNAQNMDLLNRWRHFEDDEEYWALFDEKITDLSNQIFGEVIPLIPAK